MNSNKTDEKKNDKNFQNFCQKLPKMELHAHLNGSLSEQTLAKLYKMKHSKDGEKFDFEKCQSFFDVMDSFSAAHSVTDTPEAIYTAAYDTIKEFNDDNVIYLELRSTPRAENKMTKKDYVLAILRAIETCKKEGLFIKVKLLISINRKQGFQAAKENIYLAMNMKNDYKEIVGIDLSGDPTKGDAFIQLLEMAREAGLKIAAHCAELPNVNDAMAIIKFKPDRLGHGTCIHPLLNGSAEVYQCLLDSGIPVELCLTSNIKCRTVSSYEAHHFQYLYQSKHPICICTDDKGIFNTTLSKEIMLAAEYFNLSKSDLVHLMKSTINYAFTECLEKKKLHEIIDEFAKSQL